jgi:hypothetical protein
MCIQSLWVLVAVTGRMFNTENRGTDALVTLPFH